MRPSLDDTLSVLVALTAAGRRRDCGEARVACLVLEECPAFSCLVRASLLFCGEREALPFHHAIVVAITVCHVNDQFIHDAVAHVLAGENYREGRESLRQKL